MFLKNYDKDHDIRQFVLNDKSMNKSLLTLILFFIGCPVLAQDYKPHCFAQPCSIKGDFDGDGKEDTAELVEKQHKRGIRVKFGSGKEVVVGAGNKEVKGLKDLMWMNIWELHKGQIEKSAIKGAAKPPSVKGDSLKLSEEFASSGILYWDGKQFKWYQQVGK